MATVTVVCTNPDCVNLDVAIDVPEPADPADLAWWRVFCGPCGQILHERDAAGDVTGG